MATHIGYKKCKNNKIVKLEILGENNEERSSVVNKRYAKFRCSEARVLGIYKLSKCRRKFKKCKCAESLSLTFPNFPPIKYKVGEVVKPDTYDENIDKVCGGGIHYFLTKKAAVGYDLINVVINEGKARIEYGDNGNMLDKFVYNDVNCKRDFTFYTYHSDGSLRSERVFFSKDGERRGPFNEYYENGQLKIKCTSFFKDYRKCGPYEEYYSNGQLKVKCTFSEDGKMRGLYEAFSEGGICTKSFRRRDD